MIQRNGVLHVATKSIADALHSTRPSSVPTVQARGPRMADVSVTSALASSERLFHSYSLLR
jgi:hypothetical protein